MTKYSKEFLDKHRDFNLDSYGEAMRFYERCKPTRRGETEWCAR